MTLVSSEPLTIRAYIANCKITSGMIAYAICAHHAGKKIVAIGSVRSRQPPYVQMIALDNFLSAVDDADLFEGSKLGVILRREYLRQRLDMVRAKLLLRQEGQIVRTGTEDPERWEHVAQRAIGVGFRPALRDEKHELDVLERLLIKKYRFRDIYDEGPLVPREACLNLDISKASPLTGHEGYLLSFGSERSL